MASRSGFSVIGLTQAQAAVMRAIEAVAPKGALGSAVREVTLGALREAVVRTHVDTGALRGAQRAEFDGVRGVISTDPSALNPRSRRRVIEYAGIEHSRGYPHDYYAQVIAERATQLTDRAVRGFVEALDG